MAEALGLAACIHIIGLSARVTALCVAYSTAVWNAKSDVERLQDRVESLRVTAEAVRRLLDSPHDATFEVSRRLLDSLNGCSSQLAQAEKRLDQGRPGKVMRRVGFRALRWPFESKEIENIIANLERYEHSISLGLQVDQTELILDMRQRVLNQAAADAPSSRKRFSAMPFGPDPDFVDRPDILAWIKEKHAMSTGRMALIGLGGLGKSQIAIHFANYIRDTSPQTAVFWVHASAKSRFEEAYRTIAETLQLPQRNDSNVNVLGLVSNWLQNDENGPWLMVLDSADDVDVFYPNPAFREKVISDRRNCPTDAGSVSSDSQKPLASFLPKSHNGTIIITSRSMDVAERLTANHRDIFKVSVMDYTQAFQLFQNKINEEFDEDDAADLLHDLNYIPLAITQAAAYINRRAPRISVKTYLDKFRTSDKKKKILLKNDAGDLRRDESASNSIVATWQITFEQIRYERPSAANLLSLMSFFNPQDIPGFALYNYTACIVEDADETDDKVKGDDESEDDDELEEDLTVLCGYSLVSMIALTDTCEMHSLVQFCTRCWLTSFDDEERWKRTFLRVIAKKFSSGSFETWPICQKLFPHMESIINMEPSDMGDLKVGTTLMASAAWYMCNIGSYREAEEIGRKAVDGRKKVLGPEHPDTLGSMHELAITLYNQGKYEQSEQMDREVLELREKLLGREHPDTLEILANIALAIDSQGQFKQARELYREVLEGREKVLGREHPDTLWSMSNFSVALHWQGKYEESEKMNREVLALRKKVLGQEHPDTLMSMNNVAGDFAHLGNYEQAEQIYRDVLELREKVLGPEHPDTLEAMDNLAGALDCQGKYEQSEQMHREVLGLRGKVLGREHPDTLESMNNLAEALRCQGKHEQAEQMHREVLALREKVLGREHHRTLESMNNLAITLDRQGKCELAKQMHREVLELREKVLGGEDPDTLDSMMASHNLELPTAQPTQ